MLMFGLILISGLCNKRDQTTSRSLTPGTTVQQLTKDENKVLPMGRKMTNYC